MPKPKRFAGPIVAAVAAAVLVALVAAGCGGSSNSPKDQLDAAFSHSTLEKINSGVVNLGVKAQAGPAGSFDLTLSGPFSKDGAALSLAVNGSGLAGKSVAFKGSLTVTSNNLYLGINGKTYELGAQRFAQLKSSNAQATPSSTTNLKEACKQALQKAGKDSSPCDQIDTSSWITGVTAGSNGNVDGVPTKAYSGRFDLQKVTQDILGLAKAVVPQSASSSSLGNADQIAKQIDSLIQEAKFSADVGASDGIPRKGNVTLTFGGPAAGAGFTIDGTLAQVNRPQTIAAPPGPILPIEQLRKQLPAPLRSVFGCLLNAKGAAELKACGAQASGGAGLAPVR